MKKNILCLIPARGGSKGLPHKNILPLSDKPLISYAINTAKKINLIDKIIVSTDSSEIAEIAKSYGAEIPFLRPKELAQDSTTLYPVLIHAIKHFDEQGWKADVIISFQPTSPLTRVEDLENGIKKILETNCDSVSSVCKNEEFHPFRAIKVEGDKILPLTEYTTRYEKLKFANRQNRPAAYGYNGSFYIYRRDVILNWNGEDFAYGKDRRAVVMDRINSVNIDSILDFKLAELILKENFLRSN